jgi:branched-chain amino acid transport system permease protein
MVTILFDGVAYGMLLFVLACGLSVTLGLMNFVNLAHGAFAMTGGYVAALLTTGWGWSFFWCLPAAFLAAATIGALLERTLYQRLYRRSHLDQVLFTIGITFMAVSAVEWAIGPQQQTVVIPSALKGRIELLGGSIGVYRRAASGSTSIWCSPSPSRSAPASPAWAARWALRSWAWTRGSR